MIDSQEEELILFYEEPFDFESVQNNVILLMRIAPMSKILGYSL